MIQKKFILLLFILCNLFVAELSAQAARSDSIMFRGKIVEVLIMGNDTIIIGSDFDEMVVSGNRYKNRKEAYHYERMKKRAIKVHPFAVDAIRIFREVDVYTKDLKKRNRKKHIKRLHKELKVKFEDPLKKLSRYEGFVLMSMVERELQQPLFDIVKSLKGWFPANYWNNMAKVYGYSLTSGYDAKKDPILENILEDLDISYDLADKK